MKILEKTSGLHWLSVFALKTQMTLSIGYFIIAWIAESMINYSCDIIKQFNHVYNFIYLGMINFVFGFVWMFLFEKKLKKFNDRNNK